MKLGKHWREPIWYVMGRRGAEDWPQTLCGPYYLHAEALLACEQVEISSHGWECTLADIRFPSDVMEDE